VPRHIVEIHAMTHTCPANPEPHAVDTWQALIETIPTGPCQDPRKVHLDDGSVALVDCATVLPPDRCCLACTVTIEVQAEFTTHLGPEPVSTTRAQSGNLPKPCPVCGFPVAAIFADTGQHLTCTPRPRVRGAR
jgi:hypothetical protein